MHSLRRLGFDRVEQLAAAPRALLVRRFGTGLLRRLDQALGHVAEPIAPVLPPETIQHRLAFLEPLLTAEAFFVAIDRLVEAVCAALGAAGQGARRLDLLFERVDASLQVVRTGTARASRDARHLARLLGERLDQVDQRLDQVDPGLGVEGLGVEAMRLVVSLAEPLAHAQAAAILAPGETGEADIAVLVDRLENRLGIGRVYRVIPVESDVPERSARSVPALSPACGRTWPAALPRPVRLLTPPHPIEAMAMLPDHPPAVFTWRRVRHRVRHADGPERIAGEWWRRDGEVHAVRDYWRVETEQGRRFWLYRSGDGVDAGTGDLRWFLHGFF